MPDGAEPRKDNRPWGGIAALLAACLVTLIGVVSGVEPATIVLRAAAAGALLGVLASVASALLTRVHQSP